MSKLRRALWMRTFGFKMGAHMGWLRPVNPENEASAGRSQGPGRTGPSCSLVQVKRVKLDKDMTVCTITVCY